MESFSFANDFRIPDFYRLNREIKVNDRLPPIDRFLTCVGYWNSVEKNPVNPLGNWSKFKWDILRSNFSGRIILYNRSNLAFNGSKFSLNTECYWLARLNLRIVLLPLNNQTLSFLNNIRIPRPNKLEGSVKLENIIPVLNYLLTYLASLT